MANKYMFFWNGMFSNWHECYFVVNGIQYNCGEQYMMYQKAIFFKDFETANKILQINSPRRQKALGRVVKNFDKAAWDNARYEIVKKGLREKFSQNAAYKDYLLQHKDYIIVEASPEDDIWGIGFDEHDALANIDKWGQNLLGKMLTELAQELTKKI